jgi:hypothetical protein
MCAASMRVTESAAVAMRFWSVTKPAPATARSRPSGGCGEFSDAGHFARRFRAAYGMSPTEWRQLHRGAAVLGEATSV